MRNVIERSCTGLTFAAVAIGALLLSSCGDPVVSEAERAVKADLRDPGSAKFSDVERCGASKIMTGKVNAKNKYGAYAGDITFYVDGPSVVPLNAPEDGPFNSGLFGLPTMEAQTAVINACTAGIVAAMDPKTRSDFQKSLRKDEAITNAEAALANAGNAVDAASDGIAQAADEPMDEYSAADEAEADRIEAAAAKYPNNCYKDYCPCEHPEGMDSVLCDQLEAGLDVPIESMIAGRGFREARRQAAELGYGPEN